MGKQKGEKAFLPLWVPTAGSALQVILLVDGKERRAFRPKQLWKKIKLKLSFAAQLE